MVVTSVVLIRLLASRAFNQLRCWTSYALSLCGVVRVRHLPTFVSVEPANFCQLRCPECPVGNGSRALSHASSPDRLMSMSLFERIISEVYATVHTMQFYFQGEPLLNRQLPEMIAKAHQLGLYTIVSTNAQALTCSTAEALVRSGLSRIIVSIDGFTEESYAAYRVGGSLQRALEGLKHLSNAKAKYRSRIRIELQVLRLKTNEHEWQWIRKHYKQLGATHLVFKTAQLYDYEHGHSLMPTQPMYSRYRLTKDGTYRLHASWLRQRWANNPCYRLWSGCVVTTTGQVLPCCYDKAAQHALGTLAQSTFADIWFGKKADDFRGSVLKKGNRIAICQSCNH